MHKTFISFYHKDIYYKNLLVNTNQNSFIDTSVSSSDISDELPDDSIRKKIRDEHLRDSTVTVLLCGNDTKFRKHIDWELFSSMHDGTISKKSGIVVVILPEVTCNYFIPNQLKQCYSMYYNLTNTDYEIINTTRTSIEEKYAPLPSRIKDQLENYNCNIPVIPWDFFISNMEQVIDVAYNLKDSSTYSFKAPMRDRNS